MWSRTFRRARGTSRWPRTTPTASRAICQASRADACNKETRWRATGGTLARQRVRSRGYPFAVMAGIAIARLPVGRDHRHFDRARLLGRVPDSLRRLDIVAGLREQDVGHVALRVAVVERKPARLDLHHDA